MNPLRLASVCLCLSLLPLAAQAADFPPVTEAERALTSVAGEPNAPAVVLFKKGEVLMSGFKAGAFYPYFRVHVRMKILTEEGKNNGEISVFHSDFDRLQRFEGRTLLPDGRVIPLPAEAKFERRLSRSWKHYTTVVAFPAVEVGAILDYTYELKLSSDLYPDPWYFSEEIPVLDSEIVYKLPKTVQARIWIRDPFQAGVEREVRESSRGTELKVWAKNLPSVPADPYGPPYADLATWMILAPTAVTNSFVHERLTESWSAVCKHMEEWTYGPIRRRDWGVAKRAREIAGSGSPRRKAEALYRFVRDEIEADPNFVADGVYGGDRLGINEVLSQRRGGPLEKALLLQSMLAAVRIDSRLLWAGNRERGTIDLEFVHMGWFDSVFVLVELEGQRVVLDPSDRSLAFGHLQPGYEGTQGLIHDPKKPEVIVLPETPFDQNVQRAEVDLALDDAGRLSGKGTLLLTGHRAWERIHWQKNDTETEEAWKRWLSERYKGFQISGVQFVEAPDERKVTLTWTMAQREEEVLGDEASVLLSAPLGLATHPFLQPAESRRSAVMFDFPYREEVELRLRWPEGWTAGTLPKLIEVRKALGALSTDTELRDAERSLIYRRRLDITSRELKSPKEYESIRSLFRDVETNDAQSLLLVRR